MAINGVDVSEWNDSLTAQEIKNTGYKFAIARTSGTYRGKHRATAGALYTDTYFNKFYNRAKACGLYVGAYHYSTASTRADGIAEREYMLKLLRGKQLEYPVFLDVEEPTVTVNGCLGFLETMENAGYYVGIYANYSYFTGVLKDSRLDRYLHWLAWWISKKPVTSFGYGIWQNTSELYINGKRCDGDISYNDYAEIIKTRGKNGYKKPDEPSQIQLKQGDVLTIDEIKGNIITLKLGG